MAAWPVQSSSRCASTSRVALVRSLIVWNPCRVSCLSFVRMSNGYCLPVIHEVLGRAPRERLNGEGRIPCTAAPHNGGAKDAEVGYFMGEPPSVHDIRFRIVAHASATVSVR